LLRRGCCDAFVQLSHRAFNNVVNANVRFLLVYPYRVSCSGKDFFSRSLYYAP